MQWLIIPIVVVVFMLIWVFDRYIQGERKYKALLKTREPINDEELARCYFDKDDLSPEIPGAIRTIFASHMGYTAEKEKMLPDDDLGFYWHDLDCADLVQVIESHFQIVISDEDAERTKRCTIRSISELVSRLLKNEQFSRDKV